MTSKKLTQEQRVARALVKFPRGIHQGDFLPPNVCDHGTMITRVGARIYDLRNKGAVIESRPGPGGLELYILVGLPEGYDLGGNAPRRPAETPSANPTNGGGDTHQRSADPHSPGPRSAIFDDDWDQAA